MRATWRPLPAWPYEPRPKARQPMKVGWTQTLDDLATEIEKIAGSDVIVGIVAGEDQFRMDGTLKPGFRTSHPGAEVSFDTPDRGRIAFHTDAYETLTHNLRAISNALEALRAVDRYGVTSTGEQYAGFAMLGSGDLDRGKRLVEAAGGLTAALKAHHPDKGGNAADFAAVMAFKEAFGGR